MERSIINFILNTDRGIFECIEYNEAYKEFESKGIEVYNELMKTLNDEQKEKLEKLVDLNMQEEIEASEIFFKAGVKVAVRLMAECMFDGE